MNLSYGKKQDDKTCLKCGVKRVQALFDLPGISFNWLAEEPWICEKCIAEVVSGKTMLWREDVAAEIVDPI